MHGRPGAASHEPARLPDLRRHRLGYGKGTAMKLPHTLAIGALLCAAVVTAALAQQSINSSQMATSLANVSGNNRLAMTGAQMRQAVLDYIRDNPRAPAECPAPPRADAIRRRGGFRLRFGGHPAFVLSHRRRHRRRAASSAVA